MVFHQVGEPSRGRDEEVRGVWGLHTLDVLRDVGAADDAAHRNAGMLGQQQLALGFDLLCQLAGWASI